jgi:putative colanic acid biosynthesis acetyltransferase WcaF
MPIELNPPVDLAAPAAAVPEAEAPFLIDTTKAAANWSLKVKLARVAWGLFTPLFWSFWGRLANPARIAALRLFGARIAKKALICGGVRVWMPWNLRMGEGATLGPGVEVYNFGMVTIGDMTTVSQYAYLCSATHDYALPNLPLVWCPITIGKGAWVCARAFVGPRVTIGDGAVIGACAVVTRDMPAWTVCAGNPCKPLKPRVMKS